LTNNLLEALKQIKPRQSKGIRPGYFIAAAKNKGIETDHWDTFENFILENAVLSAFDLEIITDSWQMGTLTLNASQWVLQMENGRAET